MAAVRKNGSVWEITGAALGAIVAAGTIVMFFISITAAGVIARQQLQNATPVTRHDSLLAAVQVIDTAVHNINKNVLGLNCQQANYPSPFCDNVPRVMPSTLTSRSRIPR